MDGEALGVILSCLILQNGMIDVSMWFGSRGLASNVLGARFGMIASGKT